MQRLVKTLAALFQFGAQIRLFGSGHTTSCHSLLFCCCAFHPISSFELRNTGSGLTATESAQTLPIHRRSVKEQAVLPGRRRFSFDAANAQDGAEIFVPDARFAPRDTDR